MLSGFNPQDVQDLEGARQVIAILLNLVEDLKQENQELRAEVQRLRDEINRLKGEQGKPDIKANKGKDRDHSSEKERKQPKSWRKSGKVKTVHIDREERLTVEKEELPADAQFKGYEEVVIQDIRLTTDNIRFLKEKYYSPSAGRTYLASLPPGYVGEFGPGVRSLVLTLYYASGMTEPKIEEFLRHFNTPMWVQRRIEAWPQNRLLTYREMDDLLQRDVASLNEQQKTRILEAAALTAYQAASAQTHHQFRTPHR